MEASICSDSTRFRCAVILAIILELVAVFICAVIVAIILVCYEEYILGNIPNILFRTRAGSGGSSRLLAEPLL